MANPSDSPSPSFVPLRQPPGLYLLFIVEMWERFSYFGMRALLVLYLTSPTAQQLHLGGAVRTIGVLAEAQPGTPAAASVSHAAAQAAAEKNPGRGWAEGQANLLYGWYTGLAYLLPLVGGFLADRLLGTHRSVLMGGGLMALGHITLAVSGLGSLASSHLGMSLFIGGLALIILGTGYFKPCMVVMVGQLYSPDDPRRNGAFTIFYMGVNLGAFICPFVCGTLGEEVGWHWGFGSAAVGMISGLLVYLCGRPRYLRGIGEGPKVGATAAPLLFPLTILLAAGVAAIYYQGGFTRLQQHLSELKANEALYRTLLAIFGLAILGAVAWFVIIQKPGDKGPTAAIFLFILFNAVFWMAFEQAGSTLNTFARDSTDRHLFSWSWAPSYLRDVPATWFQSVNPLLILALAPVFGIMWTRLGQRGLDPSQAVKIGLGLLLLGAGYVFMVIGGRLSAGGAQVSMFWLLATYSFHTFGELCMSPTGLAFVTRVAPVRYVALLAGVWNLSSSIAQIAGGVIASYVKKIETGEVQLFWYQWDRFGGRGDFFFLFVLTSFGAGLFILVLNPLLKRLLHGRG